MEPAAHRYVQVERLGAGGMGEVWKAWDPQLARWVALKLLKQDDPEERTRFLREARTAARLQHPNIAAVYEAQDTYIAMQLVDGPSLATAPRTDRRDLVRLIRDAALALQFAHEQGVVHRDLKPHNLMVDAGGRVVVLDFGLAKSTRVDSSLSVSGAIVGTPAYMAPEQAAGLPCGPRSDVYSLGATLYELLSDRPPFRATELYALLQKIVEEEPKPPPVQDRDLRTIVMTCLEKDGARRYESMRALANDLTRWLEGEPIRAHAPSIVYRIRKRLAKRKAVVAVGALGLAAVLAVLAFVLPQVWKARRERDALARLGTLWAKVVLEKQGLHNGANDPAEVRRRIAEARAQVDAFLAEHPDLPQGHYVRARAGLYLGELDRAEEDLRKALDADPEFAPGYALLGWICLERYLRRLHARPEKGGEILRENAPLLDRAREALSRGWGDASIERWGLLKTPEDEVVEVLARALWEVYGNQNRAGGIRILEEAYAAHRASDYCRWLGIWKSDLQWLDRALLLQPLYAEGFLSRGSRKWVDGDLAGALADLSEAVRIDPGLEVAWYNRGCVRLGLAGFREAAADFDRAIAFGSRRPEYFANRAAARSHSGDREGALADYAEAIRLDPSLDLVYYNRGLCRQEGGDLDGAMADFEEAIRRDERDHRSWHQRGVVRQLRGDLDGAEKDFLRSAAIQPSYALAHYGRGVVLLSRDRVEEALAEFDKAVRLEPSNAKAVAHRGAARQRQGDVDGAMADYEKALELDPSHRNARLNRALVFHSRKQYARAIEEATRVIDAAPDPISYRVRADSLRESGDFRRAEEDYSKAIEGAPRDEPAHHNRALCRAYLGDSAGAIRDLTRAIELNPRDSTHYYCRGLIRSPTDPRGALEDYEKAVEANPRDVLALTARGSARHRKGDREGAKEDYDRAIEIDPKYALAWCNRGILRQEREDLKGAVEDYGRAIALRPGWAEAHVYRGDALRDLGDFDGAENDYSRAIELQPKLPTAHGNRGRLRFLRAGREPSKAAELLRASAEDLRKTLEVAPKDWAYAGMTRDWLRETEEALRKAGGE